MRNRVVTVVVGLALLLAVQGCSIQIHLGKRPVIENRPPDIAHSRLVDNTLRLDLRRHPTRDDLGMNPTTTFAGYGSTKRPIQAVVDVPGATLTFPRTDITFATSEAGGANDPSPAMHQPRFFTLYVHYPDQATARADAVTKAPALGLTTHQVDAALADASGWHDEYGVPHDWLSARLGFNHSTTEGTYTAFYFFDLDIYHNPVLDAIKHGDTVVLDLRKPPSRAALGFLPGFTIADVYVDPGHRPTVELYTPAGKGIVHLDKDDFVGSSADGPEGQATTSFLATCAAPTRLRSELLAVTDALGLDRDRVAALPTSVSDKPVKLTLTGQTSTFRTKVKYDGAYETYADGCVTIVLEYQH